MGKKILSIFAGYALWTVIWIGTQQVLLAIYPEMFAADGTSTSTTIFAILLAVSPIASILSGMLTVKIVDKDHLKTVYGLVAALLITGLVVQISVWDTMPIWYHIPFLVMLIPMPILGARIISKKTEAVLA